MVRDDVVDNSLSALSFDFLGGASRGSRQAAAPAATAAMATAVAPPVSAAPEPVSAAAPAAKTPAAVSEQPAPAQISPGATASSPEKEEAAQTVVLAQGERLVRVVSAPRRRAWGLWYGLRTAVLVVLAFCVGSVILTLILNPDLTFAAAVQLLAERIGDVFRHIKEYLGW